MTNCRIPLSCFIIARDEADRIGATIASVIGWVDEVIVIDSGSTDGTQAVAEDAGAKVLFHSWEGYGLQKRFGEMQCKHHWLLNLDADEEVSVNLAAEIQELFVRGKPPFNGYAVCIREILPTEKGLPRFGRSVCPVRLYNRKAGRYSQSPVHDRVQFKSAKVSRLKNPVWHRSSRGLSHSVQKIDRYSTMQAQDLLARKGRIRFLGLRVWLCFPAAFLKAYILRGYIFKGIAGFINAVMYAFSRFLRLAKMAELMGKK